MEPKPAPTNADKFRALFVCLFCATATGLTDPAFAKGVVNTGEALADELIARGHAEMFMATNGVD